MVYTKDRLKKALRYASGIEGGNQLPLDKMSLTIEPVIVERIYPTTCKARVMYRDTVNSENPQSPLVDLAPIHLTKEFQMSYTPKGTLETCPLLGIPSINVEDSEIVGLILAIGGDMNNRGAILFIYTPIFESVTSMSTEPGTFQIKLGNSSIIIKDESIEIDSPTVLINGYPVGD